MAKAYEIACVQEIVPLYVDIKKAVEAGRMVHVEVKTAASKTTEQMGYYRKVVLPRVRDGLKEQGNEHMSLADVNQLLNEKFFHTVKTIIWKKGNDIHTHQIVTPRSKSGATKDEMSQFIDDVIRWAALDLGVHIPDPAKLVQGQPTPGDASYNCKPSPRE